MSNTFQDAHPMLPSATHDELAEQLFNLALKGYLFETLGPPERALAEALDTERELPLDERARRVRKDIHKFDSYRNLISLRRTAQEAMWDSVITSIERQAEDLNTRGNIEAPLGELRLDSDFVAPAYLRAADTHMMPGGYHHDPEDGSVLQGAMMDRGGAVYMLGRSGGLMNDGRGQCAMSHVLECYPGLKPERILDLGCGVGASTLPAALCFPDAQVHGLDVGASVMRYAHARAERLGIAVHFSQQSAEHTDFPDESFDLVYSCALMHETSHAAMPNIVRESHRLLRTGGVAVHLEVPMRYEDLDLWDHLGADFETRYNNEPFWMGAVKADMHGELTNCGFRNVISGFQAATREAIRGTQGFSDENLGVFRCWQVASGQK